MMRGTWGSGTKPSKYKNVRVTIDGMTFDSAAEARRYCHLVMLQSAGRISNLTRQVSFVLAPPAVVAGKRKRALVYQADFQYTDENGVTVVEDKKGMPTEAYKIKRHLMKTIHNIDILET